MGPANWKLINVKCQILISQCHVSYQELFYLSHNIPIYLSIYILLTYLSIYLSISGKITRILLFHLTLLIFLANFFLKPFIPLKVKLYNLSFRDNKNMCMYTF